MAVTRILNAAVIVTVQISQVHVFGLMNVAN